MRLENAAGSSEVESSPERVRARTLAGVIGALGLVIGLGWSLQAVLLFRVFGDTGPFSLAFVVPACAGALLLLAGAISTLRGLRGPAKASRVGLAMIAVGSLVAILPLLLPTILASWASGGPAAPAPGVPAPAPPAPGAAAPGVGLMATMRPLLDVLSAMCFNWALGPIFLGLLAGYTWLRHRAHLD